MPFSADNIWLSNFRCIPIRNRQGLRNWWPSGANLSLFEPDTAILDKTVTSKMKTSQMLRKRRWRMLMRSRKEAIETWMDWEEKCRNQKLERKCFHFKIIWLVFIFQPFATLLTAKFFFVLVCQKQLLLKPSILNYSFCPRSSLLSNCWLCKRALRCETKPCGLTFNLLVTDHRRWIL